MRLRLLYLPVAGIVGAAVAVLLTFAPGGAPASTAASSLPSTGSFTAVDIAWNAGAVSGSHSVTIAPGGTVSFSYPQGGTVHNADFGSSGGYGGGAQPSSCTETAPDSSASVPPLPPTPTAPGWSGSCTFNTPGTYTFHCDFHQGMIGTIVVGSGGGTTTTTTTQPTTQPTTTYPTTTTPTNPPPTTTTASTPPPPPPSIGSTQPQSGYSPGTSSAHGSSRSPGGSPLASAASVSIAAGQHGSAVRGSVAVSRAGAGGHLEVDVFVTRAALSSAGHGGPVRVGVARASLHAGVVRFSVALSGAAKRALARHGRLAVTVKLSLVSPRGVRASATRQVVLRSHG